MADVRAVMTGVGYEDVRTHLQSGNVLFRGPDAPNATVERAIADALVAELGLSVAVLVRTADQIGDVVANNTLPIDDPSLMVVLFTAKPLDRLRLADVDP